ncbi:hypothetical protein [Pedobacter sp. L105]|uniref:hypothetical protein n=1 Tax=Pedobacter sp. L105 TaxID=1641871 RepID=UPI00131A7994
MCYTGKEAFYTGLEERNRSSWDNAKHFLYSPKPSEWSYYDWYRYILSTNHNILNTVVLRCFPKPQDFFVKDIHRLLLIKDLWIIAALFMVCCILNKRVAISKRSL